MWGGGGENISICKNYRERKRERRGKMKNFPEMVVPVYEDDDEKRSERVAEGGLGGMVMGMVWIPSGFNWKCPTPDYG